MATLTRRQLMVRGAKIGSGVGALLLVGCGESEEAPTTGAAAAPGVVQEQAQGADGKQSERAQQADADAAPVEAQAAEQVEVQEAQQQARVQEAAEQEVAQQEVAQQVAQQVVVGGGGLCRMWSAGAARSRSLSSRRWPGRGRSGG